MIEKSYRILDLGDGDKELLMDFADPKYELLTMFFYTDIVDFGDWFKENFDMVLSGKSERRSIGGNVCSADIAPEKTRVCNELSQSEEEYDSTACEVDTKELRELIEEWCEELRKFREARKEKE